MDTVALRRLYVLFFIDLERRKVFLAGATGHPAAACATQQARNLAATLEDQGRAVRFLLRDRDTNAFAERFVRTARAECLDWVLIRGERQLDRVLREFVLHYNHARPHRGIDLEAPVPYSSIHPFNGGAGVQRTDRIGGLLHEYRVAA